MNDRSQVTPTPHGRSLRGATSNRIRAFLSRLGMGTRAEIENERVQRELLRVTLASIGDAVIVTDHGGRVRSLNPEAERITGWSQRDALGKPISDVFHIVNEYTGEAIESPVVKALRLGRVVGLANHTVLIAKNGTRTAIDDSAAPIREDGAPLHGVVLVFRDVTQERVAQRAHAHLAAIVQYSGDAIITKNLDGVVQSWNASAEKLFGYSADEIVGKSITILLPPELLHEEAEILARLRAGEPSERMETERITKDGRRLFVSISVSPLRDRDGSIVGASKIVHDITDRKVAEAALRENEVRFRSMADAAPVLIWVSDRDKLCTWFNRQWLEFVGRTMEQEIGNGWADNVHPEDYQQCLDTYVASFDARRSFTMIYRLRRHDGVWRWMLDNGIPRHDSSGQFAGYIGSCVDITPQREAEEKLREADRRKDEFLAILSHELRNPLAPIAIAADLLRRKPTQDPEERTLRDVIARQTTQLTRLLDDLLDVNRIRSGKIVLRRERTDLGSAVNRAVESVAPQFAAKKQDLTIDLPEEPVFVNADPTRIAQVAANLLGNASKFTPARGSIALRLSRQDGDAVLSVKDSGIGLNQDQIPHIFDMFAQVEPALGKTEGGLGVGLALTRMLVDQHGGTIDVKSEGAGRGSEFIVRLPALESPAAQPADSSPVDAQPGRYRVLVADDNVDSALMLSEALRQLGHDVRATHDGIATLEVARSFAPQVAFLDIGMPRMNGYDVGKQLREEFGDRIMLVAVTGWGQEADRRRAREASFDHHLVKPVDLRAIEKLLEHAFNSHT